MVVISPRLIFSASLMTFVTGAMQFVVQEALEIISTEGSYLSSFTPITMISFPPLHTAVTMTFFTPSCMCFAASSTFVKTPVDSRIMSTFSSPHGIFEGSGSWK